MCIAIEDHALETKLKGKESFAELVPCRNKVWFQILFHLESYPVFPELYFFSLLMRLKLRKELHL